MRHPATTETGFSLVEMIIALSIATLVVVTATGGWIHVLRTETLNSTQTELDLDVRKSIESLKHDLRLTALDKIYFYPPGPGPYTAISFPMARDDDGDGTIEMAPGSSNILWDSTVIYHVWSGTPNKLLRTVFSPRDNSLSDAQCQAQLTSVATNGSGAFTYGGSNATTRTIFANLFTWAVWGKSATYDAYAPTLARDQSVSFGSIYLTPGSHTFKFQLRDKNALSTGYSVGIDSLVVSPSGCPIEGETKVPPASESGGTSTRSYMSQGSWSGNYQLLFPSTTSNGYFTLTFNNDRWEETNFRGMGSSIARTLIEWDSAASPKDFILRLEGCDYTWDASLQTAATNMYPITGDSLTNCAFRTLIRGSLMQDGAFIKYDGRHAYFLFYAPPQGDLKIRAACIAPADNPTNFTVNAAGAASPILFGGSEVVVIPANSYAFGYCSGFVIEKTKSYLVSFLVDTEKGNAYAWDETHPGAPGSYMVRNALRSDLYDTNWSSKTIVAGTRVVGLAGIYTLYPTNGLFTSQVIDTKVTAPVYSNMTWSSEIPSGTSLKMKVRAATNEAMTDAPAWSNVTAMTTGGAITPGAKRYVQFQAILNPDSSGWSTPKLKDVAINWAAEPQVVDVGGTLTKGPNYGVVELTIDDKPLVKGLRVDLTIYEDITGWGRQARRVTSSMSTEIEPRNTGK